VADRKKVWGGKRGKGETDSKKQRTKPSALTRCRDISRMGKAKERLMKKRRKGKHFKRRNQKRKTEEGRSKGHQSVY